MNRTHLAALAAGAVLATSAGAVAQAPEGRTLTFHSKYGAGSSAQVDLGRKDFSPGDVFTTYGETLLDARTGERRGSSDGLSQVISRRSKGTMSMSGTLRLAGGTLQMQGVLRHSDPAQTLAVVGGTGAYEGARGSVMVSSDDKAERNVWEVHLLPER